MGHYAKVVEGKVVKVIVADQDFMDNFIDDSPGLWLETSYNTTGGVHVDPDTRLPDGGTPLRYNFAGVGFTYDAEKDAFIEPQPYASWVLNETTCQWHAPVEYPDDGEYYTWNEETVSWELDSN